ncbi:hypothetical protein RFI_39654, partial [Reticulomyxa filosa]
SENQSFNTWIQHNQDTSIGKFEDYLIGVRELIGGKNNDLLFITKLSLDIEVIDLKTMKLLNGIKDDIMPTDEHEYEIGYHCFVNKTNHFIFKNYPFVLPSMTSHFIHLYLYFYLVERAYKTWHQCKITLPMEIHVSSTISSNDDTSFHVIGGLDAKGGIQKMHVSVKDYLKNQNY